MNRDDVHAFWRDPETGKGVSDKYRAACQPEHYVALKAVSEMWLKVFAKYVPKDATILELGCSVGRNLYYLRKAGYEHLAGVEINPRARQLSAKEFGAATADCITVSSLESYTAPPGGFDVIFSSGVLMHIHPDSEWIFAAVSKNTRRFIMVAEVEEPVGAYKWPRQYRPIFEGFGFTQIHEQEATPMSAKTTLRVFRREAIQPLQHAI